MQAESDMFSPVEERHLDYILEEEFCVSSEFLHFFIEQARRSVNGACVLPEPLQEHGCKAVRSVTTDGGESDVLVTYQSAASLPTCILIEDKIRAGFQPDQPSRYRERGEAGKGSKWSEFWTCLVAHQKYASGPGDFDAIITLQQLRGYFEERPDARSQFRAHTLDRAIQKYEISGLQSKHEEMTRFRSVYASEFEARFSPALWWHQPARDAWWDDTWFECRRVNWPNGVLIRHQSKPGHVQLIFPVQDKSLFSSIVTRHAAWQENGFAPNIEVVAVGKGKLAFQVQVTPVLKSAFDDAPFEEFFSAIEYLANFYQRSSDMLPEEFRLAESAEEPGPYNVAMRALRIMLLAYMRSTVMVQGTAMPFPLPDLENLTSETLEAERHFPSFGLRGGFSLELFRTAHAQPYVLATYSSRDWGDYEVQHRITADAVQLLGPED